MDRTPQGAILHLDLESGERRVRPLEPQLRAGLAGGRALCGHLLLEGVQRAKQGAEQGGEERLVFAPGGLAGSGAPGSSRCHVAARSPLTGALGDASLGGTLGLQLRAAGWDALVITGRAPALCGLEIDGPEDDGDKGVRLVDAEALRGLNTVELLDRLRQARPSGAMVLTGPAADAGSPLASLLSDGPHDAGRCGLGLVLARRNLKYLAVRGHREQRPADPAGFATACEDMLRLLHASPALTGAHGFDAYGPASLVDLMDARRMTPTDNFARTHFPHAGTMNAHAVAARRHPSRHACPHCPVRCHGVGPGREPLPGHDALSHFSALLGNANLELALRANALCARLGLDPVGAASALACRREITGRDMDPDQVLELITGMALNRGAGAELAQGSAAYARRLGRPELSMSVKGLDLPACDPRGGYGLALALAVSTRGGCHQRAFPLSHEVLRKPVATDRFSFSGKARAVAGAEDAFAAAESLGVCTRLLLALGLEELSRAWSAFSGLCATGADLARLGATADLRERLLNAAWGVPGDSDDLPPRFFAEPGSGAPDLPVPAIPRQGFLDCRAAYRRIRGLDEDGRPRPERLAELGLAPLAAPSLTAEEGA